MADKLPKYKQPLADCAAALARHGWAPGRGTRGMSGEARDEVKSALNTIHYQLKLDAEAVMAGAVGDEWKE